MKLVIGITIGLVLGVGGTMLAPWAEVEQANATAQVECSQMNGDVDGDAKLGLSDVILLLQYIFLPEAERPSLLSRCVHPCPLPATGQSECYGYNADTGEWEVIDCLSEDYPGQDGFYQAGCPTEGRFVDNGDGTVTDNCTGLMWQQETADTDGDGKITGADELTWQDALQYCEELDSAGHTDWRLPNVRELQSIVDYGRVDPAIDTRFFSAASSSYWSSSSRVWLPYGAWVVRFNWGDVAGNHKEVVSLHVRAVRGGL